MNKKLSKEELAYLAGVFESTLGLRGLNAVSAVAIANTPEWPQAMSALYGGTAEQFTSAKEKTYWGWFVPLPRRLDLLNELEAAKVLKAFTTEQLDVIRKKLERTIGA